MLQPDAELRDKALREADNAALDRRIHETIAATFAAFGLDLQTEHDDNRCVFTRDTDHSWMLSYHTGINRPYVDWNMVIKVSHEAAGFSWPSELQANGKHSPLSIALMLALYPILFGQMATDDALIVVRAATGQITGRDA